MDFVAGCLGGAAGCIASHPLDTVKVHMQCCHNGKYRSTVQCVRHIIQKESVLGLYKGLASPLCTVAAVNAICFGTYGHVLRMQDDRTALSSHAIAGAAAGLAMSPFLCPVELVKTRLQMQHRQQPASSLSVQLRVRHDLRLYSGPVDCVIRILKTDGATGLYRGMLATLVREVPAIAVYFPTFEWLKSKYQSSMGVESCPLSVLFLAGGVAGCVSWTSSYPADVIKSRMQLGDKFYQTRWRSAPTRITYSHHIRMALHKEGFSGLFRGLPSTYIRALPNNGAALTIVAVFHSLVERSSLLRTHGCIAYDDL